MVNVIMINMFNPQPYVFAFKTELIYIQLMCQGNNTKPQQFKLQFSVTLFSNKCTGKSAGLSRDFLGIRVKKRVCKIILKNCNQINKTTYNSWLKEALKIAHKQNGFYGSVVLDPDFEPDFEPDPDPVLGHLNKP